jgi:hypothetical protein
VNRSAEAGRRRGRRLIPLACLAAATGLLAAACGTEPAPGTRPAAIALHARQDRPGRPGTGDWPAALSHAGAAVYARHLLASVSLPRAARLVPGPHGPIASAPTQPGPIMSDVLALQIRYRISSQPADLISYLQAHAAPRLMADGWGTAGAAQTLSLRPQATPAPVYLATVDASAAPAGTGGSLLTVTAEVAWYPPRGSSIRISAADYRSVTVSGPRHRGAGRAARTVTAAGTVARLADQYDALYGAPDAISSCPAVLAGSRLVPYRIAFNPAAAAPAVVVTLNNCGGVMVTVAGRPTRPLAPPAALLLAAEQLLDHG